MSLKLTNPGSVAGGSGTCGGATSSESAGTSSVGATARGSTGGSARGDEDFGGSTFSGDCCCSAASCPSNDPPAEPLEYPSRGGQKTYIYIYYSLLIKYLQIYYTDFKNYHVVGIYPYKQQILKTLCPSPCTTITEQNELDIDKSFAMMDSTVYFHTFEQPWQFKKESEAIIS